MHLTAIYILKALRKALKILQPVTQAIREKHLWSEILSAPF